MGDDNLGRGVFGFVVGEVYVDGKIHKSTFRPIQVERWRRNKILTSSPLKFPNQRFPSLEFLPVYF